MSAILNWYKVLSAGLLDDPPELPPRVLIHGGSSVKSGTLMQCWGVQYAAKPKIMQFELFRRHFLSRSKYTRIDTLPARFGHSKEAGSCSYRTAYSIANAAQTSRESDIPVSRCVGE